MTSTYHVKLKDGNHCMLSMKGWFPADGNVLTFIGVGRYFDGRAIVVFFGRMSDGTLVAHKNPGLSSYVVEEIPF